MNADDWNKKGEEYWQNNDIGEALTSFQKATELEPRNVAALYNEGAALVQLSRNDEGKEIIKKAMNIKEEDAVGYVWLAIADYRLGNVDLAKKSIQRALQLDENEKFAMMVDRYIENGADIVLS